MDVWCTHLHCIFVGGIIAGKYHFDLVRPIIAECSLQYQQCRLSLVPLHRRLSFDGHVCLVCPETVRFDDLCGTQFVGVMFIRWYTAIVERQRMKFILDPGTIAAQLNE